MSQLVGVQCVLAVPSLAKSVEFYRNQLGLTLQFEIEGWAFLERDQFRVMLGECSDAMPVSETGDHSYFAYITVTNVDELYLEFMKNGVSGVQQPANKPWRMREFALKTPDGHRITFGQEIKS